MVKGACSVAKIVELQRTFEFHAAQQCHRRLQIVALLAVDAQLVAVDLRIDLQFGILERGLDFLRQLAFDALFDRYFLPAAGEIAFDVAELQAARIDAACDQTRAQDVGHLFELKFARCGLIDEFVVKRELRFHALEVEAGSQLAIGLIDSIGEFVKVDFGDDIERGHGGRIDGGVGRLTDAARAMRADAWHRGWTAWVSVWSGVPER